MLWLILAFAAFAFAVGVWRGEEIVEMFVAAVALAVGAIPEGLPAAVTITLAVGVARMARRRAIIRKLPAVETLGSTTVICSDKTGTLTENQMTVQQIFAGGQFYEVTGTGYAASGIVQADGKPVVPEAHPALLACLRAGLLCNDSVLIREDGKIRVEGDPTEAALIVAAEKAGLAHAMSTASSTGSTRFHSNPSINSWQLSIAERRATSFTKKARLNAWLDAVQRWRRPWQRVTD